MVHINKKYFTAVLSLFFITLLSHACAEETTAARVLHFPDRFALGKVFIQDSSEKWMINRYHYWAAEGKWHFLGPAIGDVRIPAGKRVSLILQASAINNPARLSSLKMIDADSLYKLIISPKWARGARISDRRLDCILHLKGLKLLNLSDMDIAPGAMHRVCNNLANLERLYLPKFVPSGSMKSLRQLRNLKGLYFTNTRFSRESLKYLRDIHSLEELAFNGKNIDDSMLKALPRLDNLEVLFLAGNYGDDGIRSMCLQPNLRILTLFQSQNLTNVALKYIDKFEKLEALNLTWLTTITDEGLGYLTEMESLKKLAIGHIKLTDKGCGILKKIKTLEHLHLPRGEITDNGIAQIGELHNLRYLWAGASSSSPFTDNALISIARLEKLEELNIGGKGITNKGVKAISKLGNLKELTLFSAPGLDNEGLLQIAGLKALKHLSILGGHHITLGGLKALNSLSNLESLSLKNIKQDNGLMDISGLKNLISLSIEVRSDDSGREVFRDKDLNCLKDFKKLETLKLFGLSLGDDGIRYLQDLKNLEILTIGKSHITDAGLGYLTNMPKLLNLRIVGGHFSDKGIDFLQNCKSLESITLKTDKNVSKSVVSRLWGTLPVLRAVNIE